MIILTKTSTAINEAAARAVCRDALILLDAPVELNAHPAGAKGRPLVATRIAPTLAWGGLGT